MTQIFFCLFSLRNEEISSLVWQFVAHLAWLVREVACQIYLYVFLQRWFVSFWNIDPMTYPNQFHEPYLFSRWFCIMSCSISTCLKISILFIRKENQDFSWIIRDRLRLIVHIRPQVVYCTPSPGYTYITTGCFPHHDKRRLFESNCLSSILNQSDIFTCIFLPRFRWFKTYCVV